MAALRVPRSLALRVLTRVLSDHQPLDEVMQEMGGDLKPSERAWLLEVCAGVLRFKGRLETVLDSYALKKKPTGWLRKVLLLATYQLLEQRVHPGAVVSETVDEIKKKEGEAPARFGNALLRKVSEHSEHWKNVPAQQLISSEKKAAWSSLPIWFWKRLVAQQGEAFAFKFAEACLERPKMWMRKKESPVPILLEEGGDITLQSGFREGDFIVQDISSQTLVAEMATAVRKSLGASANQFLDLCASPGGKSIGVEWQGFSVTSCDHGKQRLALLSSSLARVGSPARVLEADELAEAEKFDWVWVDAPCTGSGIIRRHPDVRWIRQERDIATLQKKQIELLKKGLSHVRPGGMLSYSVCSVFKDEGEEVLRACDLSGEVVQKWFLVPQEAPFGDGFWAALIQRP